MTGSAHLIYRAIISASIAIVPCSAALAQVRTMEVRSRDSVTVTPGAVYAAGSLHRSLWGDNYRDEWTTPIRVPVLDLRSFGGGIRPTEVGGGKQTRSLRFMSSDSIEYVFRPAFKTSGSLSEQFNGTVVGAVFRDQRSASHPTAPRAGLPLMNATQVLHPTPVLVVMPDDPALGEFQKEFAGQLGTIEDYPSVPPKAPGFGGATKIVDSEELLKLINSSPETQVDARAMLTARLVDMVLGDNDRHPDQWRWARLGAGGLWLPIARDRDKVFVSFEGSVLGLARRVAPGLVTFESSYNDPRGLFENAMEFDRRMLVGLDKFAWDSVARSVTARLTDAVIDSVGITMPPEYAASSRELASKLKARRDQLPTEAAEYYAILFSVADVHATDAEDRATVNRSQDGSVDVRIESAAGVPWFNRRFVPSETREIRLYLHGGNDNATVTGSTARSILVRVIGGSGNNTLVDNSVVGGRRNSTRIIEAGSVDGVKYARDTAAVRKDEADALNHEFNRRPWVHAYGRLIPPQKDRGSSMKPVVGLKTGHGLGLVPRIGIERYVYGFRKVPYSSMMAGDVAYSTGTGGFQVRLESDKRFTSSDIHLPATAGVSQLEVIQFRGFGNNVPENESSFYDVKQTQWHFSPAIGLSFAPESDISIGPVVRYTSTDSVANRFISTGRPYGFGKFGQAGVQLNLRFDSRPHRDTTKMRTVLEATGSAFPGIWDAKNAYESIEAVAMTYVNIPVLTRPVLAFRAGGKKLFGDFPYFDAAFLGGGSSFRTEHRQRFAGDASLFGSAELRVPIAKFPFILPLDVGALAFADAGRVYFESESPGGWHTAMGAGFWVGVLDPGMNVNVLFTNHSEKRIMVSLGFAY